MMKKTILLFFCCLPGLVQAGSGFNEMFDTELTQHTQIADRAATYHATTITTDLTDQAAELEALQQSIDDVIKSSPEEPLYWFIKGLNHNNLAALYAAQNNQSAVTRHIEQRILAYQRAMLLDQTPPLQLSASIYATMKHGLPEADRIKAIENEIRKGGSGDSDDQYIQLHWSRVNALEKSGRHDEAQTALKQMQRAIIERELKNPDYKLIIDRAQAEINKGRAADKKENRTRIPDASETASSKHSSPVFSKNTMWIMFFGILALISVWMIVRAWRSK